jgi:hypothetical protein
MPLIVINGQPIQFPDDGASPDWAPAIIQFAEAVEAVLNSVAGTFDVPNQTFDISSYNPGTNINIPALNFPIADVQAANVTYSVYRNTSLNTAEETGTMYINYNPNGTPGSLWELSIDKEGNGDITFNILDSGQMQFTTTTLTGLNHTGSIAFSARSLLLP